VKHEEGLVGSYWSSTLDNTSRAYLLYFNETDPDASRHGLLDGLSVRPVTGTPKTVEQEPSNTSVIEEYDEAKMATSAANATAVDLGLPSGIKWATYNVGAISPEDCGYYYAWGETTTKDNYTRGSSKTRGQKMGDDISGNEKYDAATVNWGKEWRMPTHAEFKELVKYCSWTWKKHKGVWGYEVKSKQNDNSISLPAAGYCQKNMKHEEGLVGSYWSSTFDGINRAYLLYFNESDPDASRLGRYDGFSVRPVTRTPKNIE
jgi:uncharacterized protein (TIGR02145 family)